MSTLRHLLRLGAACLLLAGATGCVSQRTFASPEEAVSALTTALRADDRAEARRLFGPRTDEIRSGDPDQDREDRLRFTRALETRHQLRVDSEDHATLLVGEDSWPFAIPLVRERGAWRFDTDAGLEELAIRRIGRNELDTIQACRTLIEAQREYFSLDRDSDGLQEYARKLMSTPGQKDGLYWDAGPGGLDPSPIGPVFAQAATRETARGERIPFHGYRYKVLWRQGPGAPGGATDYLSGDDLVGGWAVIAYPDEYDVSGVMSFMLGHGGEVYEKDLGPNTEGIVQGLDAFDPSDGWARLGG